MYLQCIVLGDPLHHVWHSCLKNLLEREGVHHGENAGKVLQNLFLLLHANSLTVGHPDVRLLVICNLYLLRRNMSCYTGLLLDSNHSIYQNHVLLTYAFLFVDFYMFLYLHKLPCYFCTDTNTEVKIFGCTW